MKRIVLAACIVALSGCATTRAHVGDTVCRNRVMIEAMTDVALRQVEAMADPVKREAAMSAINVSMAALALCPSPG